MTHSTEPCTFAERLDVAALAAHARDWVPPLPGDPPSADNVRLRPVLDRVAGFILDVAASGRIRAIDGEWGEACFLDEWWALTKGKATRRQAYAVAWYLAKRPLRAASTQARDALGRGDVRTFAAVHSAFVRKVEAGDFGIDDTYPVIRTGHRRSLRIDVSGWVARVVPDPGRPDRADYIPGAGAASSA